MMIVKVMTPTMLLMMATYTDANHGNVTMETMMQMALLRMIMAILMTTMNIALMMAFILKTMMRTSVIGSGMMMTVALGYDDEDDDDDGDEADYVDVCDHEIDSDNNGATIFLPGNGQWTPTPYRRAGTVDPFPHRTAGQWTEDTYTCIGERRKYASKRQDVSGRCS